MSYYSGSNYYQNPTPYESSDIGEPVPGWGTTVSIAGPARVGVGAMPRRAAAAPRSRATTRMTPWQQWRHPAAMAPPTQEPCWRMPKSFNCSQVSGHKDAVGVRVDLHCENGKVTRYEKGTMPVSYTPSSTSFGAYGQTLNISKAAAAAKRMAASRAAREAAANQQTTTGNTGGGEAQPGAAGEPLPWWIWPAAAAVVLGGVGYYGTKKGWL